MKIIKYFLSIFLINSLRFLKIFPNNDPIMSALLPFSKQDKWIHSMLFPLIAMISFDLITFKVGYWTIGTALTYSFIGLMIHFYLRNRKASMKTYFGLGVAGILFFDLVTGVIMGPMLFGQNFWIALLGQIPFTLLHLASGTLYIALITPFLDKHVIASKNLEDSKALFYLKNLFKAK